jgi:hypothetical protein
MFLGTKDVKFRIVVALYNCDLEGDLLGFAVIPCTKCNIINHVILV